MARSWQVSCRKITLCYQERSLHKFAGALELRLNWMSKISLRDQRYLMLFHIAKSKIEVSIWCRNLKCLISCTALHPFQDSELSKVDADLALQTKIYEAARKLCEEDHLSKAVRKSRILQCKNEEKKLKKLQETSFRLQLERGRSSPLPSFNVTHQGERLMTTSRQWRTVGWRIPS